MPSSAENARSPSPLPRQAVDFVPDPEDPDFEEANAVLQGLGTTTLRTRNPHKPVLKPRKHRKAGAQAKRDVLGNRLVLGETARKTADKRRATRANTKKLADTIESWVEERDAKALEFAEMYSVKIAEVRRRMGAAPFKKTRMPSLYNAKISALMEQENQSKFSSVFLLPRLER